MVHLLNSLNCGICINNCNYNVFAYADDLLNSPTVTGLQQFIDTAVSYVTDHGLRFNPDKTKCLLFGANPFDTIPNPLQAEYSGPYKVVKKISDTNYLVKTPGRRKETQVCHINMLKAYHEKPKPELVTLNNRLELESPAHSESCVGLEAEKEEDTESEVRLENDQQPIKLQNSQILNDLGTKLSHLPLVQRKELAEVITQYKEVFPDVPSKTNLIEHDVDAGDPAPIKQHPYRVSPMKKELLDKEVQYMLQNDIIEESQSNWSSPCILVPKHDGGFRFCTDFRKVNDKTKSDSFPIPRIADCIDQIGNAKFVSSFDMQETKPILYHQVQNTLTLLFCRTTLSFCFGTPEDFF